MVATDQLELCSWPFMRWDGNAQSVNYLATLVDEVGKARQGKAMAIGLLSKLGRQRQKQGEARVITSKENFW